MKLHQLSNGNWVDLTHVARISALPREQCLLGGAVLPARVVVILHEGCEVIPCDDWPQAAQMRDDLASRVNSEGKQNE